MIRTVSQNIPAITFSLFLILFGGILFLTSGCSKAPETPATMSRADFLAIEIQEVEASIARREAQYQEERAQLEAAGDKKAVKNLDIANRSIEVDKKNLERLKKEQEKLAKEGGAETPAK
ncbi:MAG: hypothetical protein J6J31_10495 [Thermoguttaceae bacterium]|nr:hypothetical protein [Thermoguttaceae bacterium]